MFVVLMILHIFICLFLVVAVLLQSGKGGGLAASLGGGMSSSSVLGGRAASTFLTKATTVLATAFMVSCLLLSLTFDAGNEAPTTAIERTMTEAPADLPTPFSPGEQEGGLVPVEEGAEAGGTTTESESPAVEAEPAPEAEAKTDE